MSICGTCGRQRGDDERFCGGCGAEFSGVPATVDGPTAENATRVDGPSTPSDTFASWYQPPGGLPEGTAEQYQPTQTALPTQRPPTGYQAQPAGYQPQPGGYQPPPAGYPGPQPGPPFAPGPPAGGPQRGGPRGLLVLLAVIVVLAAGGGAYALATTLGKHPAAQPPVQPTISASPPAGGSAGPASSGPPASPAPSPTLSLVAIGPGAGNVSPSVEELLSHYFHGINFRDYAEYASTLSPAQRASPSQSQAKFESGYETTTDSAMTVTSLGTTAGGTPGGLTATVTFTSPQSPEQSVDHSGCNAWTLNFYLVPQGSGYLIGPAPSSYKPDHSDC